MKTKYLIIILFVLIGIGLIVYQNSKQKSASESKITSTTYSPSEIYNFPLPPSSKFSHKVTYSQCKSQNENDREVEVIQTKCGTTSYYFLSNMEDNEEYNFYHGNSTSLNGWTCMGGDGGEIDENGKIHGGIFDCIKGGYKLTVNLDVVDGFSISKSY